jgi:hypothetical protein
MFDALHGATTQVDQTRLLAERSLFLAQRLPFLMRWQAEVYTSSALATREAQQTQAQIEQMSAVATAMSRVLEGLAGQIAQERQAALDDLFAHIQTERQAALEQLESLVQQERKSTLAEARRSTRSEPRLSRTSSIWRMRRDKRAVRGSAAACWSAEYLWCCC